MLTEAMLYIIGTVPSATSAVFGQCFPWPSTRWSSFNTTIPKASIHDFKAMSLSSLSSVAFLGACVLLLPTHSLPHILSAPQTPSDCLRLRRNRTILSPTCDKTSTPSNFPSCVLLSVYLDFPYMLPQPATFPSVPSHDLSHCILALARLPYLSRYTTTCWLGLPQ